MKEELILVPVENNVEVALWKMHTEQSSPSKNVFLTHGTFSNKKVLGAICDFLTQNGYTCWVFEWRNHGASPKNHKIKFNFETVANLDIPILFNYIKQEQKVDKIDCITHSGGGICLTLALINNPELQQSVNSISFFACQSFGAISSFRKRLLIQVGKGICALLGFVPASTIGGQERESYYFMRQWFNWNLSGQFLSMDKTDFKALMPTIKIPILSFYGQGDTFIAPPKGCIAYLASFKNNKNKGVLCSKSEGFAEDYTHSRILHSRNASKELYPMVLTWMQQQAIH